MDKIRWGILGTGHIAHTFASDLRLLDDAVVQAVGSRTREHAEAFADEFDIPNRHARYEDLARDEEVDVVYVATPHPAHAENMITCLDGGKAVLCEKPFTMNAAEAERVFERARASGLFVMDGMWTRCFPVIEEAVKRARGGELGELTYLDASFCAYRAFDPEHRLYKKELGGGALLDLGVYPVSLAVQFMDGLPDVVQAHGAIGASGVDEQTVMLLGDRRGLAASLSCSFRCTTPHTAVLAGARATLLIEDPWTRPSRAVLVNGNEVLEEINRPLEGHGFVYEAREVMRCLREGLHESPAMPHAESLTVMRIMDAVRQAIGLEYGADG